MTVTNRRRQKAFALAGLAFAMALAGATYGCKPTRPGGDLRGDYDHGCPCNDVECWRKNTQQGSKDALKCAASSLSAAADLATAGQASNVVFGVQVVAGVWDLAKDISGMASRSYSITQDGLTRVNIAGLLKEIATGSADAMKYAFGTSYEKNPRLACWSDIIKHAGAVANVVGAVIAVHENSENAKATGRQFGFAQMGNLSKFALAGTEGSFRLGLALSACLTNSSGNRGASDLKALNEKLKKIGSYMKAGLALVDDCGINLLNSGYVLARNSVCLARDIDGLVASRRKLDDALESTLNRPAPNPPGKEPIRSCNGEQADCNLFAMTKFGIWLGQQTYFSYLSRSSACADKCGNGGKGRQECADHRLDIFQGDAPYCAPVCRTSQCEDAVMRCLSFCCKQDTGCTDAARKLLYMAVPDA